MNHSDQIDALAGALAKAQGDLTHAQLDSKNPAFKRDGRELRYPSLRSVIDACRPALAAQGLAVVQTFEPSEPTVLVLTTTLLHESGQWLSGTCTWPVERPGPQGYASCSTYARRYSLMSLVGLAPEDDDDGNAASQPRQELRQQLARPESAGDKQAAAVETSNREALIGEIHSRFKALHTGEKFYPWASRIVGRPVAAIGDLDFDDLSTVNAHLCTEQEALAALDVPAAPEPTALLQGAE